MLFIFVSWLSQRCGIIGSHSGAILLSGITAYGYAFYALVARNDQGRGTPLAYCISSDDSSVPVQIMLESLKNVASAHGFAFQPRYR